MKSFLKLLLVLGSLAGIGVLFAAGVIAYFSYDLPATSSLNNYRPAIPSKILSKDGEVLLEVGKEKRELVQFEEIPTRIVDAFLSAEDDKFYEHSGVDLKGILRAALKNIKAGRVVQGASTITQQVAKSLLLTSERTFSRKIKDMLLAVKIEQEFSKEQILFLYLNQVYLGGGYYGVKAAFRGYFEKELSDATVAEAALIAGLLVAPGKYSPYINPQYAKKRQRYVLSRMKVTGKITEEEYQEALSENIRMYLRKPNRMKAGYFTDWIRQRVIEKFGEEKFLTGGLTIQTTLNWELQKKAEVEVKKGVLQIDKRQGYKGPLGKIENTEEFLSQQRNAILKENSTFFIFKNDGEVELELSDVENADDSEIIEKLKEVPRWLRKFYVKGNDANDIMNKYIELDKNYEAVVLKVDNRQRSIYVRFAGGLTGLIPYDNFKWAHERNITDKRTYWQYVKRPSQIVSKGDKILVQIKQKPKSSWRYLYEDFKKEIKNEKLLALIKKEKFYILSLEQEPEAQSALVSISPQSGEVLSLVGGYDFNRSQFNRAIQSNRQPGSAFKPLLFAAGLENGFKPNSILLDTPSALGSSDESLDWKPSNYDGKFKGEMTLRRALETSRNIPTIKLVQQVGVQKIKDFISRFKMNKLELPNDLSISLGSFGINLLDLVKMYSIFPNMGKSTKIVSVLSIKDSFGKEYFLDEEEKKLNLETDSTEEVSTQSSLEEKSPELSESESSDLEDEKEEVENPFLANLSEEQIYDKRLAYIMNNLMKGVIKNGTGRTAKNVSPFIGGKTGTTNNYVDAWFLGYSTSVVTGVWTGFDNNQTLGFGETGGRSALPIWREYMRETLRFFGDYDFAAPAGIINVSINKDTGELAKSLDDSTMIEAFVEGHGPEDVEENTQENTESDDVFDDDYLNNQ